MRRIAAYLRSCDWRFGAGNLCIIGWNACTAFLLVAFLMHASAATPAALLLVSCAAYLLLMVAYGTDQPFVGLMIAAWLANAGATFPVLLFTATWWVWGPLVASLVALFCTCAGLAIMLKDECP
ncbi:MAG: hypothetical protein ACRYHQ_30910 [Janthinobacterium lividum]